MKLCDKSDLHERVCQKMFPIQMDWGPSCLLPLDLLSARESWARVDP